MVQTAHKASMDWMDHEVELIVGFYKWTPFQDLLELTAALDEEDPVDPEGHIGILLHLISDFNAANLDVDLLESLDPVRDNSHNT